MQLIAVFKCAQANHQQLLIRIWNNHLSNITTKECIITNVNHAIANSEFPFNSRIRKGITENTLQLIVRRNRDSIQIATAVESKIRDLHHGIRNQDIFQPDTAKECTLIDTCKLIVLLKNHRLQFLTVGEGIVINAHHRLRNGNGSDVLRFKESPVAKGKNIGIRTEANFTQLASFKSTKADFLHSFGNR